MKKFVVKCINWKTGNSFTFSKNFPSAFRAWIWADRFLVNRKSQYILTIEEEIA